MVKYVENCHVDKSLLDALCTHNDVSKEGIYCEFSCHTSVNGYVGSFFCKESEYPSVKPSGVPSLTLSEVPIFLLSAFPYSDPSIVTSRFPSQLFSSKPSKNPISSPSIFPSFVPYVEYSNYPSSFPSYSTSISIQPISCTGCYNIVSPEIIDN